MPTVFNLPGNGPWRVLDDCPAIRHNTLGSARGRGTKPCICPRALALIERERERTRQWNIRRRDERGLPSTVGLGRGRSTIPRWLLLGPWMVLEECPAASHNTLYAARGGRYRAQGNCVCPRSLALLTKYRKDMDRSEQRKRRLEGEARRKKRLSKPVVSDSPDWRKALCRQDVATADLGFNTDFTKQGVADRAAAKALCLLCPILLECREWIVRTEGDAPGSLGGVYGGMDPWNRQGLELVRYGGRVVRRTYVSTS